MGNKLILKSLMIIVGFCTVVAAGSVADTIKQQLWFAPPYYHERMYGAQAQTNPYDMMKLFEPGAPWAKVHARTDVFKIYHWQILQNLGNPIAERDTSRMFAYLKAHRIALALEFGPLTLSNEGGGGRTITGNPTEAYQFSERAAELARAIKRLGGKLDYIAMDEPFCFGLKQWNPSGCQTSPVELAKNAVQSLKHFREVFPRVQVGDIENIIGPEMLTIMEGNDQGRWIREYGQFVKAMRVEGFPLQFYHGDVVWQTSWAVTAAKLQAMLRNEGVAFGIIFNASELSTSDALWMASAERKLDDYKRSGITTDHQVFQSWNPYPTKLLPENDPYTLTHLMNAYFDYRPNTQANYAKLYRLYYEQTKKHIMACTVSEINASIHLGARVEALMGYIYTTNDAVSGLVPLHRLNREDTQDTLYLTSEKALETAKSCGYRDQSILGYVYPAHSGKGWPMYGVYLGTECLLSTNKAEYELYRSSGDLGVCFEVIPF